MDFRRGLVVIFVFLIVLEGVLAVDATQIISNSENWEDVYSSLVFANLNQIQADFLASTAHGNILADEIEKENKILVISSSESPFVFNYPSTLESKGFEDVKEIETESANLKLIDEMPEINNFIIVGNSYGYGAIAVAPYAIQSKSWVFLADRANIAEIDSILSERNVQEILIYGYVDREIEDALEKYNPEKINSGDKFEDNIEITKKYLEINPVKQVVLTNGEFIEKEIMQGAEPVLFTGKENVPDKIAEYLKNSEIEVGVLIGNELIGAATNIRRSAGISVMVKFARGARGQTDGVSAVEGLDLFYLPSPNLELEIYSIRYNKATSNLEVTYQSNSNVPAYFKGTITLKYNSENQKVGDVEPIFISPGNFKTVTYSGINQIGDEEITGEIYTLYGESESSLDRILQKSLEIEIINIIDNCEIEIVAVNYNKQKEAFTAKVKNLENYDCWINLEIENFLINGVKTSLGTEDVQKINSGRTETIEILKRVNEEDLADNEFVEVVGYYGEKRDSLVKVFKGRFRLDIDALTGMTYAIIILIALLLIIFIIFLILRNREEKFKI